MEAQTAKMDQLASRRQEFEAQFANLRQSVGREVGWTPKGKTWIMPLTAFACGVAIAGWWLARRR